MTKHVYANREIAHLWMHKTQGDARNGNNTYYFQGPVIYSYGSHFPIATHITGVEGRSGVLFTSRDYSSTTSQHKGYVRRSIPSDVPVFTVPNLNLGFSKKEDNHQHRENLEWYHHRVVEHTITCARARSSWTKEHHQKRAVDLRDEAFHYAEFFGRKPPLIEPIPELDSDAMAAIRSREATASAKKAAKKRAEEMERIKKAGSLADLWRQGGPGHYLLNVLPTMLRLVGHEVETSLGARFPITHAKKGLTLVRAVMARGELWTPNGRSLRLGHYSINQISPDGTVRAGCHVVTWPEIERVAEDIEAYEPRVKCDQCQMLSINGMATHETGCPNSRKLWDEDDQSWVAVQEENNDELEAQE